MWTLGTIMVLAYIQLHLAEGNDRNYSVLYQESCEMHRLMTLIKCGNQYVQPPQHDGKIVLIMGNSQSGKTTLTRYVGGEENNLTSRLVAKDTNEFLIYEHWEYYYQFNSDTVYPKLYFDKETGTMFYDCPSFTHFLDYGTSVIGKYFIKKIIKSAREAKIVLTVSHAAVSFGESKHDLLTLLSETALFITNVTHFQHSVLLVVTKTENRWIDSFTTVGDEPVLEEIYLFIQDFKNWLLSDLLEDYPFPNAAALENVLHLTDIILSNYEDIWSNDEDNEYAEYDLEELDSFEENANLDEFHNIALFRKPDRGGAVSEIKILYSTKPRLLEKIHHFINFTTLNKEYFNYNLDNIAIILSHDLKNTLSKLIMNKTIELVEDFEDYKEKGGIPFNIGYTKSFFQEMLLEVRSMHSKLMTAEYISEFADFMLNTSKILNSSISENKFLDMKVNLDFLQQVDTFSGGILSSTPLQWISPVTEFFKTIQATESWYSFMSSLYKVLSTEHFQNNKELYDVEDIDDWGKGNTEISSNSTDTGLVITELNFHRFLEKMESFNLDRFEDFIEYNPTERQFGEINEIIETVFRSKDLIICEEGTLNIIALYINIESIKDINCSASEIVLFAAYEITIDADMSYVGDKVNLVMISPTIIVMGSKVIDMSGKNAVTGHTVSTEINFLQTNGNKGKAGVPGYASGNFIGACNKLLGKELTILAEGGMGSNGQSGGHGGIGISRYGEDFTKDITEVGLIPDISLYDACTMSDNSTLILMKCGFCGASGGDGGKGGTSGPNGEIKLVAFSNTEAAVKKFQSKRDGKDGYGGRKGKIGRNVVHTFKIDFDLKNSVCGTLPEACKKCNITVDGLKGESVKDLFPSEDKKVPLPEIKNILDKYNTYYGHTSFDVEWFKGFLTQP